jgi:hypothetical protein
VVAVGALLTGTVALLALHQPPADAQPVDQPLQVMVSELSPLAPTSTDTLRLAGRVTNTGGTAVAQVVVQLRVSARPLLSRSSLADSASSTQPPPGSVVGRPLTVATSLAPGASVGWTLEVPGGQLGLSGYGVYPMAVEARGTSADGTRGRLGTARTFVTWGSDTPGLQPTRVAVLWPVLATPAVAESGTVPGAAFATELAGRLTDLVRTASGEPVSWVLDGDLLESVSALADGGPAAPGSPGATVAPDSRAAQWLTELRAAVGDRDVNALGYADPDAVAVTRAGLADDLRTAVALGPAVVRDVLGRSVTGDLAWPADGTATLPALNALKSAGVRAVVLSDAYTPTTRTFTYTASAVGPIQGSSLTGVVTDRVLSALLATPVAQQGGPVLARQRFLSELAMVTAERPFDGRAVVVAPPRYWQPDVAYDRDLLSVLRTLPWVQPQTVEQLRAAADPGVLRQTPTYPSTVAQREVTSAQLGEVRAGRVDLQALTSVLSQPQPLADRFERGLLRAESSGWRDQPGKGLAFARTVTSLITKAQASVRIVPSGPITLTSRSGQIPITVANDLDQPVTVLLAVDAVPSVRMTLKQPGLMTVAAGSRQTVEVAAKAAANGRLIVQARLYAPDGQVYGPAVGLTYRIGRAIRRGRRPVRTSAATDGEDQR